jgi:hypothetical protein
MIALLGLFLHSFIFVLFFKRFSFMFFFSLTNDTYIFNPTYVVPFIFDHFISQLVFVGLVVLFRKCLTWMGKSMVKYTKKVVYLKSNV